MEKHLAYQYKLESIYLGRSDLKTYHSAKSLKRIPKQKSVYSTIDNEKKKFEDEPCEELRIYD